MIVAVLLLINIHSNPRLVSKELLVKVRDRDGHKCRAAFVALLDV